MAKKKNKEVTESEKNYYKLNSDAVNRLAGANKENAKKVSDKELNKYKSSKLSNIPVWLQALLVFSFIGALQPTLKTGWIPCSSSA